MALRLLVCVTGLLDANALSHEDITLSQWNKESKGKKVMLDMYAGW